MLLFPSLDTRQPMGGKKGDGKKGDGKKGGGKKGGGKKGDGKKGDGKKGGGKKGDGKKGGGKNAAGGEPQLDIRQPIDLGDLTRVHVPPTLYDAPPGEHSRRLVCSEPTAADMDVFARNEEGRPTEVAEVSEVCSFSRMPPVLGCTAPAFFVTPALHLRTFLDTPLPQLTRYHFGETLDVVTSQGNSFRLTPELFGVAGSGSVELMPFKDSWLEEAAAALLIVAVCRAFLPGMRRDGQKRDAERKPASTDAIYRRALVVLEETLRIAPAATEYTLDTVASGACGMIDFLRLTWSAWGAAGSDVLLSDVELRRGAPRPPAAEQDNTAPAGAAPAGAVSPFHDATDVGRVLRAETYPHRTAHARALLLLAVRADVEQWHDSLLNAVARTTVISGLTHLAADVFCPRFGLVELMCSFSSVCEFMLALSPDLNTLLFFTKPKMDMAFDALRWGLQAENQWISNAVHGEDKVLIRIRPLKSDDPRGPPSAVFIAAPDGIYPERGCDGAPAPGSLEWWEARADEARDFEGTASGTHPLSTFADEMLAEQSCSAPGSTAARFAEVVRHNYELCGSLPPKNFGEGVAVAGMHTLVMRARGAAGRHLAADHGGTCARQAELKFSKRSGNDVKVFKKLKWFWQLQLGGIPRTVVVGDTLAKRREFSRLSLEHDLFERGLPPDMRIRDALEYLRGVRDDLARCAREGSFCPRNHFATLTTCRLRTTGLEVVQSDAAHRGAFDSIVNTGVMEDALGRAQAAGQARD